MFNLRRINILFLLVISFTWPDQSEALINYENVILECKFKKRIQIHTKRQSGMHFKWGMGFDRYDLTSVSFKESHDRIIWSYRNIHHLSRGLPIIYKYEFFKTTKKIHLEFKYEDSKNWERYRGMIRKKVHGDRGWGTCEVKEVKQKKQLIAKNKQPNKKIISSKSEQEKEDRIKELENKLAALQSDKKKTKKKAKPNEIGSGFYVSKFRHVLTNQHVVNQCKKTTVGDSMSTQIPADLIASDKKNDLAILQTISMEMASADTKSFVQRLAIQIVPIISGGLMRSEDVRGGEQIYVAGYPLGNMVSEQMKLGDGIVSATKGMEDDITQFIISSDIKKGNSGGPIYDNRGNIVGVAVSRLNVNRTDTINFAIKGSTVKQFLSVHNVPTKWSNRQKEMNTKDIYKIASKQTVMVVCHR